MLTPEATWDNLDQAHAVEYGHFILKSGLHSNVKIKADRLIGYDLNYRPVMNDVKERLQALGSLLIVPVPNGARNLFRYRAWNMGVPYAYTRKSEEGKFTIDEHWVKIIQDLPRLTVFEDVVTTGGSPAEMAQVIRNFNPKATIDLLAIAKRGDLAPEYATQFSSQHYLVEKQLPVWPESECPYIKEHGTIK